VSGGPVRGDGGGDAAAIVELRAETDFTAKNENFVAAANKIAEMALDMQAAIAQFRRQDRSPFSLRIGIDTGPVVAGVIGPGVG